MDQEGHWMVIVDEYGTENWYSKYDNYADAWAAYQKLKADGDQTQLMKDKPDFYEPFEIFLVKIAEHDEYREEV